MKDAFLRVPREKPLKVNLRGEGFSGKRIYLDKELGQKHGLTFSQSTSPRKPIIGSVPFSAECPCLGRNEKSLILIHVDGLVLTGCSKYINENFFQRIKTGLTPA